MRELAREWFRNHPDVAAEQRAKRRARLAGAKRESYTRSEIIARDKSTCHLCGGLVPPGEIHLDHIVPIARGGDDTPANVAVAHASCNRRKGARVAA